MEKKIQGQNQTTICNFVCISKKKYRTKSSANFLSAERNGQGFNQIKKPNISTLYSPQIGTLHKINILLWPLIYG